MKKVENLYFLVLVFLLEFSFITMPDITSAQTLGDPSLTLGKSGSIKIEVGGGTLINEEFQFETKDISINTSSQNYNAEKGKSSDKFNNQQFFLTTAVGLGATTDFFIKFSQNKFKSDFFENKTGNSSYGAGFRFTSPSESWIKIGLLVQVLKEKYKDDNYSFFFNSFNAFGGSQRYYISASGKGTNELDMTRFNIMIGFSMAKAKYVQPYGALLLTKVTGVEKINAIGTAGAAPCNASGSCSSYTTEAFSTSFERSFELEEMINGVFGIVFNPAEKMGITIETRVGRSYGVLLGAFVSF